MTYKEKIEHVVNRAHNTLAGILAVGDTVHTTVQLYGEDKYGKPVCHQSIITTKHTSTYRDLTYNESLHTERE